MPTLLKFVEKSNPILREVMPNVDNFKSTELSKVISDMCYSILPSQLKQIATHENAAGMAANQWGLRYRVFLFTPDGSANSDQIEVMINPSYIPYLRPHEKKPTMIGAYEGCFSIPLTTGLVNRYEAIVATFYDLEGTKIECVMEGWNARVFQHETDHLDGKLYDGKLDNFAGPDCIDRIIFKDEQEMENFWTNRVRPSRME